MGTRGLPWSEKNLPACLSSRFNYSRGNADISGANGRQHRLYFWIEKTVPQPTFGHALRLPPELVVP